MTRRVCLAFLCMVMLAASCRGAGHPTATKTETSSPFRTDVSCTSAGNGEHVISIRVTSVSPQLGTGAVDLLTFASASVTLADGKVVPISTVSGSEEVMQISVPSGPTPRSFSVQGLFSTSLPARLTAPGVEALKGTKSGPLMITKVVMLPKGVGLAFAIRLALPHGVQFAGLDDVHLRVGQAEFFQRSGGSGQLLSSGVYSADSEQVLQSGGAYDPQSRAVLSVGGVAIDADVRGTVGGCD
jgi:hypothetical protein